MKIFDTHCHLNLDPLHLEWENHWERAKEAGIVKSFLPGTNLDTSAKSISLAAQNQNFLAGAAIHPGEVSADTDIEILLEQLSGMISQNSQQLSAIGETGLDYFRLDEESEVVKDKQRQLLRGHLDLALKFKLPVSIHVRDRSVLSEKTAGNAYWDTLGILQDYSDKKLKFVLHCASGPAEYLNTAIKIGGYAGFAGNITYPNADNLRTLLAATPKNRIMVETDAPFLPPQEFRGKVCEPWMISKTVEFMHNELGIDPNSLIENAENFFTRNG